MVIKERVLSVVWPVLVLLLGASILAFSRVPPTHLINAYLIPPKGLDKFSFGYELTMADSLWIRAIQLFDVCDEFKAQVMRPKVGATDNAQEAEPIAHCHKGVLFKFLDVATDLDPDFRIIYRAGAPIMSVLISDVEGARILLEKGLAKFPTDRNLLMIASYHSLFELNNKAAASDYLRRLGDAGGPPWVYSLSVKLMSEAGEGEAAEALAQSLLESEKLQGDERVVKKLQMRLDEIRGANAGKTVSPSKSK
jgi:hypothetical protein